MRPPHAKGGGARDAGRRRAMAAFIVNARATALMTALMAALMTALMAGAALAADSGEFAVSASGSGAARSCVAVFKPRLAAGEDKAPKLTLATIGRSQIAASVERPGRFSVATLVRNNIRTPFPIASGSMANEQFRASLLGKALASRQRFYVTAQLQDGGDYVSSQYEGIDFDAVLKTIESQCPFDAESLMSNIAAREKAEAALRVSKSRMTLIRWALNEKYGKGAARPAARASLSPEERTLLKGFAVDLRLPVSRYLTAESARLLTAAGEKLERQELAAQEEKRYARARGDIAALRAYVQNCKVCADAGPARKEIEALERAQRQAAEQAAYALARGDLDRLRSYVTDCVICEHQSEARAEIVRMEADRFEIEACNTTKHPAAIAVVQRKQPGSSDWISKGWWKVAANDCTSLGLFPRSKIYATAKVQGERRGWFGKDLKRCVEFPGPFNKAVNESCSGSSRVLGFQELESSVDKLTWRLVGAPVYGEDEFFNFTVCNKSDKWASVAAMGRMSPDSGDYTMAGWWRVSPGECKSIGRFVVGSFFAMAEVLGGTGRWTNSDVNLCVAHPGPFRWTHQPGSSCNETDLVPFRRFDYQEGSHTWNLL